MRQTLWQLGFLASSRTQVRWYKRHLCTEEWNSQWKYENSPLLSNVQVSLWVTFWMLTLRSSPLACLLTTDNCPLVEWRMLLIHSSMLWTKRQSYQQKHCQLIGHHHKVRLGHTVCRLQVLLSLCPVAGSSHSFFIYSYVRLLPKYPYIAREIARSVSGTSYLEFWNLWRSVPCTKISSRV